MRTEIKASFSIVTPVFLGGASPSELADTIRPPSVKGALRFWWRAVNWERVLKETDHSERNALIKLHAEEARLFGHAAEEKKPYGQSYVLLRTSLQDGEKGTPQQPSEGQKYLLGQGLWGAKKNDYLRKEAWLEGTLHVILWIHQAMTPEQRVGLLKSLVAWGLFGGLGSRSRRGIGSVAVAGINVRDMPIPRSCEDIKNTLTWLGLPARCGCPPFTAFSQESRIDCSATDGDPWALLNEVGVEMMRYRSWRSAARNFPDDHHWMLQAVRGTCPPEVPRRAVFGLPHNYFFKSEFDALKAQKKRELLREGENGQDAEKKAKRWAGDRATAELAPTSKGRTRRASPLFIHAHRFPDGKAAVIQTLLPAAFLPQGDHVGITAERLANGCTPPMTADWQKIIRYLDQFSARVRLV